MSSVLEKNQDPGRLILEKKFFGFEEKCYLAYWRSYFPKGYFCNIGQNSLIVRKNFFLRNNLSYKNKRSGSYYFLFIKTICLQSWRRKSLHLIFFFFFGKVLQWSLWAILVLKIGNYLFSRLSGISIFYGKKILYWRKLIGTRRNILHGEKILPIIRTFFLCRRYFLGPWTVFKYICIFYENLFFNKN